MWNTVSLSWVICTGQLFLDAGNVWLLREQKNEEGENIRPGGLLTLRNFAKSIALGTGVGLRYDLTFLVIRLDLGIALHDPYDTGKKGYYNILSLRMDWDCTLPSAILSRNRA